MYDSILVPLDGEAANEIALPIALSIVRRSGATLSLVRVQTDAADQEAARAYLERLAGTLTVADGPTIKTAVLEGPIAEALQTYASENGVDLVVMTSREEGLLSDGWKGDVKDQFTSDADVPVLVVHSGEGSSEPERRLRVRHVLIALDESRETAAIIPPAVDLGQLMGAEYTLLRVTPGLVSLAAATPEGVAWTNALDQRLVEDMQSEAQAHLEELAEPLRAQGLRVMTIALADGPGEEILEVARARGVDLIVMTTDTRSEFKRWLLGSKADKVLREADVPVLLYRAQAGEVPTEA